jgi:membrane associated rhomboid family serine protease
MTSLIALVVIGAFAWGVMSKEQRIKLLRTSDVALAIVNDHGRDELQRFRAARRERMRWPLVAFGLAGLNIVMFLWAPNVAGGPAASMPWGAIYGPLTSNGRWWQLVTAMFVGRHFFLLLLDVGALVQVGLTLEPMVGRPMFAVAFLAAGIFSELAGLQMRPLVVLAGPAGAIWGLYGMLLVAGVTLWRRRSDLMLPLAQIERLGAVWLLFAIANMIDAGSGGVAQLAGLSIGIFVGVASVAGVASASVASPGVAGSTTTMRRAAITGGVALAIALACAVPLRGILDIRPEVDRVVSVEHKTTASYRVASEQFRKGRMTAEALAALIDRTIVPELQAAALRLDSLHGIPAEDMPRMADAREFLRLRTESWQLRAQGLRLTARSVRGAKKADGDTDVAFRQRAQEQYQSTLIAVGKADGAEHSSLEAFDRLQKPSPAANP